MIATQHSNNPSIYFGVNFNTLLKNTMNNKLYQNFINKKIPLQCTPITKNMSSCLICVIFEIPNLHNMFKTFSETLNVIAKFIINSQYFNIKNISEK